MKKTIVIFLFFFLCPILMMAQDTSFVRKGLIRTFGCFAFDYLPRQNTWNYSLHGFLEYYPEKNVSLMGEFYKYIDTKAKDPFINEQTTLALGAGYHWPVKNLDPYIFFMGSANGTVTQETLPNGEIVLSNVGQNPGVAIGGGVNLYVWKYLNMFIQCRYHYITSYTNLQIAPLNSFSVSYGLGLNIHSKKKR